MILNKNTAIFPAQVALSSALKEVIKSARGYLKTSKFVLKADRGVNLNHKAFILREVDERVDSDRYSTAAGFLGDFEGLCDSIAEK